MRSSLKFQSVKEIENTITAELDKLDIAKKTEDMSAEGGAYGNLGSYYMSLGQYDKAIEYHKKHLNIAKQTGDKSGESRVYESLGICYRTLGQYDKAIKYNEKHLTIAKQIGDKSGEGKAYNNLGNCYYCLGQYDKAVEYHEKLLTIAKHIGDKSLEEGAYGNLGISYRYLGQYDKALEYHKKDLTMAKLIGDKSSEGAAYGSLGNCFLSIGQYDKAIEYHEKYLTIAKQIGDKSGERRRVYGSLGMCYRSLGQYDKAIEYHKKHLTIAKQIGDKSGEGKAYGNLGNCYHSLGQYEKAIEYQEKYLTIAEKIGDKSGEGKAYGNLGNCYGALGQYDKAIEYHKKNLTIAKQIGEKSGEGGAYGNLGNCYHSLGQYEKAIEYHEKRLSIAKQTEDVSGEGGAYGNLGTCYDCLRQYDKAVEYHEMHLTIAKQSGDKSGEGRTYGNLGICYMSLGQYEKAIQYYEKQLTIAKQIGDKSSEGGAYAYVGAYYISLGQHDKAVEYHEKHLTIAKQTGDKIEEGFAYTNLGIICFVKKLYNEAELNLRNGLCCMEMVSSNVPREDVFKISFRDNFVSVHKYLVRSLLAQDKTDDALVIEESLRSRALVDLMLTSYSIYCIETSATKLSYLEILDVVKALGTSVLYLAFDELEKEVLMWVIQPNGIVAFKRTTGVVKSDLDFRISKAREVPKTLTYEDRSLSFLYPEPIKREAVTTIRTGKYTQAKATSAINSPPSQSDDCLKKLYQMVFGPIRELIKGTEVVVVPDLELYLVPFAALKDDEGRYVAEYLEVRLVPSLATAQLFTNHPQPSSDSGASPLIIGVPDVGIPGVPKLKYARKEVRLIGRLLGVKPLTGREATKEKILQRIENSSLIHIAAHGDEKRGDILLAAASNDASVEDCFLSMSDLEGKCLKAKLVVLSCCHSGHGEVKAEGVIGIARSFLGAGARAVLVALWALHDEATMFFMESFYEHLYRRKKANESLYQAMKTMREKPEFNDPIYWGPFVLIGDDVTVF